MESNRLQPHVTQPLRDGFKPQTESETKSSTKAKDELLSIGEVWSEWAASFYQVEREILALGEKSVS